jgi:hypothetical protein
MPPAPSGPKLSAVGTSAVIAVAVIDPTPGIVINRRAIGSVFERRSISALGRMRWSRLDEQSGLNRPMRPMLILARERLIP